MKKYLIDLTVYSEALDLAGWADVFGGITLWISGVSEEVDETIMAVCSSIDQTREIADRWYIDRITLDKAEILN